MQIRFGFFLASKISLWLSFLSSILFVILGLKFPFSVISVEFWKIAR